MFFLLRMGFLLAIVLIINGLASGLRSAVAQASHV